MNLPTLSVKPGQPHAARHPAKPFRLWPPARLRDELRDRGGCPPEALADPELLAHAADLLGLHLHLADTYVAPKPVDTGVSSHVWFGRDDPYLDTAQASQWARNITRPVLRSFRGGHFYLLQRAEPAGALRELVTDLVEQESA
ncbi:thioesterase II family protein [Micromonospora sp. LOL_013]|uniref:thioesterase II family protein n=1 Tax=Micromonospora sp. LOL_013 TaxID=3345414 RepID=UPI003A8BBE97